MSIQGQNGNMQAQSREKTAEPIAATQTRMELNIKERTADEEAQKEFDKLLRRPRSRKYMKAMKLLDSLSETDELIIAEMKKEAGHMEGWRMGNGKRKISDAVPANLRRPARSGSRAP